MPRLSCRACDNTYGAYATTDHKLVCRRVRTNARQWWEREPGYVKDEISRAQRHPTLFEGVRNGWWTEKPGHRVSLSELSRRLPDVTWWVAQRRAELGLGDGQRARRARKSQ